VFGPDAESTGMDFVLPGDIDTKSSVIASAVSKYYLMGKQVCWILNLNKKQAV